MAVRSRFSPTAAATPAAAGFSLVELVIAVALLTTSLLMGLFWGEASVVTMFRNLNLSSQEGLIEEDTARIRSLAETFTWCTGAGTTRAGDGCGSRTPLRQDYYFPNVPPSADDPDNPPPASAAIRAFTAACDGPGLTAGLVTAIRALPRPEGLTLERQVDLLESDSAAGAQTHVLRIRYRSLRPDDPARAADAPPVDRDVLVLPTVSAWCP